MLSILFFATSIFLVCRISQLVEAQECQPFTLPSKTVWMNNDADSGIFQCAPEYNTRALSSCVDGEWEVNRICKRIKVDRCANNPCLNGGTCVDGRKSFTCTCPTGYFGETCENVDECQDQTCVSNSTCESGMNPYSCICPSGQPCRVCKVKKGYYMNYPDASMGIVYNMTIPQCQQLCSETPGCTVSHLSKEGNKCYVWNTPVLEIVEASDLDTCVRACYDDPRCTGFNYNVWKRVSLCLLLDTTAGLTYTLDARRVSFTSDRGCENVFTEDR